MPPSPEMLPFLFPLTVGDAGVPQDSAIGGAPTSSLPHVPPGGGSGHDEAEEGETPVREGKDSIETTPCSSKS